MKKTLLLIAMAATGLILLAYASGCGSEAASADASTLSRETYDKIEVGMTGDALRKMVGEPVKTEAKSMSGGHSMGGSMADSGMTMEYWYYQGSKGWVRIEVGDNKVSSKSGY